MYVDIAHDAGPAAIFSSLNKWPLYSRLGCAKKQQGSAKSRIVRVNHEMCLGRKAAFHFWCLIHVIGSQAKLLHSLSRQPACTVSASKSPTFNTARLCIRNSALPDHSPRAQASHRGLERPSELQLDSSSVPPIAIGYDPSIISPFTNFSQPSRPPFSTCCRGPTVFSK